MYALLFLTLMGGWPEKIAVADAVVTVAQAQQPDLPNDLAKPTGNPTPAEPTEPLGNVEPVGIGPVFIESDAEPLIITLVTTANCPPCEQAKKDIRAERWGRPVVVFIRKGGEGPFPRIIFTSGLHSPRYYEGWKGIADLRSKIQKVESGQ